MSNVGSGTSYRRAPGETTEWEDILRSKGILPPPEDETKAAVVAAAEEAKAAREARDPLADKSLGELERLEEEGGEFDDSRALESYRAARLAELKARRAAARFGQLYPLSRDEFVAEVTEGSRSAWVVLVLYKDGIADSALLVSLLRRLAPRHAATKFMAIIADACIPNYPDRNVPTLFTYHGGVLVHQVVGLASLGGPRVSEEIIEWVLSRQGALSTELLDDPREALPGARRGDAGAGAGAVVSRRGDAGGSSAAASRAVAALSSDEDD